MSASVNHIKFDTAIATCNLTNMVYVQAFLIPYIHTPAHAAHFNSLEHVLVVTVSEDMTVALQSRNNKSYTDQGISELISASLHFDINAV